MPAEGGTAAWQRGLPPLVDAGVRILVLGSFPSPASLQAGQYYAHPRNQFWPILGAILGRPLQELPYADRLDSLLSCGVGLWDVFSACRRRGSLDSAIEAARSNDLARLAEWAPALAAVALNGRTAGRFEPELSRRGYRCRVLPSTSPAHAALRLDDKLMLWKAFFMGFC
jgi:hypoxanthine-DNA glycosylase